MKTKQLTAMAAAAVFALSSVSALAYTDTAGTIYAESVNNLTMMNVVSGSDDGLYHPEALVTRAEFAKMLVTAFTSETTQFNATETEFTDVASDHWAVGYIAYATGMEYINGYGNGLFGPEDHVTYDQAIKMIIAAGGYNAEAQMLGGYPTGYLLYAEDLGVTDENVTKSGDDELSKGDVAILLNNAMEVPINVYVGTTTNLLGGISATYTKMDGTGEYFLSPAMKYHGTYTLEGTFSNTSTTSEEIEEGTVEFTIDYSRNFDGEYYPWGADEPRTYIFNVDSETDTDSLYQKSAKIHVKKDTSGEWWIVTAVI